MKRSVIIGAVCALLTVGVAWATQVWRDNTDGGNHSLGNVSTIQANNGIGSGTRCAQFDSAGNLQPNATACGAGLGGSSGVSSVTGTAQHISATPTTGAVVVDTIGGYSTGAVTGGNVSMGAFASGVDEQTTTAGVAAPFTYQSVAGAAQFGAASGGGLAQDAANYFWDTANTGLRIGGGTLAGTSNRLMLTYANTSATVSAANALAIFNNTNAGGQTIIAFQSNGSVVAGIRPDNAGNVGFHTTGGQGVQFYGDLAGSIHIAGIGGTGFYSGTTAGGTASHGAFESDGSLSTTGLYMGFAGTEFIKKHGGQLTVETDDAHAVVIATNGTAALTATTSQQLNVPATAAPTTPAATTATLYVDSTSKNIALKNDAGTVNHGIQTKKCGGSQWVNAISDAGGAACVQPAFTDVSGSLACGQLPALGGDLSGSAGSCSENVVAVHETSGPTRLAINAVADLGSGNPNILNRPGGTATIVGSSVASLINGKTPQTMFYAWDLQSTQAVSAGVMAEGGLNTSVGGGGMPNGYPALQSFSHVTMTLNVFNNVCTGGGSPLFQVNILRNGTLIVNVPVNCGFTGASTLGTVAFSAAAGDLIEFVYDGTLFGTSAGPRVTVALTARFDP